MLPRCLSAKGGRTYTLCKMHVLYRVSGVQVRRVRGIRQMRGLFQRRDRSVDDDGDSAACSQLPEYPMEQTAFARKRQPQ